MARPERALEALLAAALLLLPLVRWWWGGRGEREGRLGESGAPGRPRPARLVGYHKGGEEARVEVLWDLDSLRWGGRWSVDAATATHAVARAVASVAHRRGVQGAVRVRGYANVRTLQRLAEQDADVAVRVGRQLIAGGDLEVTGVPATNQAADRALMRDLQGVLPRLLPGGPHGEAGGLAVVSNDHGYADVLRAARAAGVHTVAVSDVSKLRKAARDALFWSKLR